MPAIALVNETENKQIRRNQINRLVSVYLEHLFKREDEIGYLNMSTFMTEVDLIKSTVQDEGGAIFRKIGKYQKKHALFPKAKASLYYLNEKSRLVICCYVYSLDGKGSARAGLNDESISEQLGMTLCSYQHSKKQAYKKMAEILRIFSIYENGIELY